VNLTIYSLVATLCVGISFCKIQKPRHVIRLVWPEWEALQTKFVTCYAWSSKIIVILLHRDNWNKNCDIQTQKWNINVDDNTKIIMNKSYSSNTAHAKCTNKSDASKNMGNWSHINTYENCWKTYLNSMTLQNYRKQPYCTLRTYRGADKSLDRPGRKQTRKHVRDARFQQYRDASYHQIFFHPCKARRRKKFTPFWQKH